MLPVKKSLKHLIYREIPKVALWLFSFALFISKTYGVISQPGIGIVGQTLQGQAGCATCGGQTAMGASPGFYFSISMGAANLGGNAGNFYVWAPDSVNYSLSSITNVQFSGCGLAGTGVQILTNSDGTLGQVLAPQAFATITTNSSYSYEINIYSTNAVGASDGLLINVINAESNLITTWTISNPDGVTNSNRVQVSETPAGGETNTWLFSYNAGTLIWTVSFPGNLLEQRLSQIYYSPTLRTEDKQWAIPGGPLVYEHTQVYTNFSWGDALLSDTVGNGSTSRTTSYSYFPDTNTAGYASAGYVASSSQPPLRSISYPDGTWTYYVGYDAMGRPTNVLSGADGPLTNNASVCRATIYSYTPVDSSDDGTLWPYNPRTTTAYFKGTAVSLSYNIYALNKQQTIQCVSPSAGYTTANNLLTTTYLFTNGPNNGSIQQVNYPDGTASFYSYATNSTGSQQTKIISTGAPDPSGTYVIDGTQVATVTGAVGQILSQTNTDIISGLITAGDAYSYLDAFQHSYSVSHLDNTSETFIYACCGLENVIDKDGVTTVYLYDAVNRLYGYEKFVSAVSFLTYENLLDPAGNVTQAWRIGTDGVSTTLLNQSAFNNAGELTLQTNALMGVTTFSRTNDPTTGALIRTTVYPDASVETNYYYTDGSLMKSVGNHIHPSENIMGVETEPVAGTSRFYIEQIKLNSDGSTSQEWIKTYSDLLARNYKTLYASAAGSPYEVSFFNFAGQLTNQIDPDGVSTLYAYNAKGEKAYTIADINRDGLFASDGYNHITFTTNDVVTDNGINVRRTRSYVWSSASNFSNLICTAESSVDGLITWNIAWNNGHGTTNKSQTVYGASGYRYVTNTAPDGSYAIMTYQYGQLFSTCRFDSGGNQISGMTYSYDTNQRQNAFTDDRNGTTAYTFNNADQVSSITTPSPGTGQSPQVTSNLFDLMGRIVETILPDYTSVTNWFYSTGDLAQTAGSRIYPVLYTYDAQGRMKTTVTWTNFAASLGAATTTWNYDIYRGFLTNKTFNGGVAGPIYKYSGAGRLTNRAWARGISNSYSYDSTGSLTNVTYSDGVTPIVTYSYDRRGRPTNILEGTFATTLTYNDQGNILAESYSGGPLSGIAVTNGYDILLRRTNLVSFGSSVLTSAQYGYDAASRLSMVTDGTNSATYSYLANSPLLSQIKFTNGSSLRMTTTKSYDYLNRLTAIGSVNSSSVTFDSHGYSYNTANQRTSVINADGSYWQFQYDSLGQVTSGIKYWSDGSVVAGQQFGYGFDDIGNRQTTSAGGDQWGANLRYASYTANSLNQYTSRTVPGAVDVIGSATNTATVTVNNQATYRKGNYYRAQLALTNTLSPVYQSLTNLAVLNVGTNFVIQTNITGSEYLPQTPESFAYDADGNLTSDGRWNYTWDGENRLIFMTNNNAVGPQMGLYFTYDAKGRRIGKTVITATSTNSYSFVYDGWNLLAELTNNVLLRAYDWGLDLSGSMQGAGGVGGLLEMKYYGAQTTNCFTTFDGNGNMSALMNAANGNITANYEYGPFGEVIRATGSMAKANPFKFSTIYQDDETDTLVYLHRPYSASQGRFLSRDPLGELGANLIYKIAFLDIFGEESRENPYLLVDNDPVHHYDILGLQSVPVSLAEAIASGNVAQVEAILAGMEEGDAGWAAGQAFLKQVAKCEALYAAYKALNCKGCKGCVSKEQAIANAACLTAEVAGRSAYLASKCDYCLARSIARGSAVAAAGHATELANKTAALARCTAAAATLPSASPPPPPTPPTPVQ